MQGSINFDGSLVGNITGGGGGGGDTVVITPVVTSGTKIADVSVNGVEKDLYCPTPPTPPQIDITPVVTSGTKIADVSVGGVEKDLYAPDYGADITALDSRLDTAEDNITGLTNRMGAAEGNITNLSGRMTEAENVIGQIDGVTIYKQILNQDIVSFSAESSMPIMKLVSNISNVSGCTEANIVVTGKNIFGGLELANAFVNAGGTIDTVNKTVSFTHGNSQVNILDKVKLKESTRYTFILTYSNTGDNNSLSLFYKTSGTRYPINLKNSSDTKITIVYTTSAVTIDKLVLGWVVDASTKIYYEESGLFEGVLTAADFENYNGNLYNIPFVDGGGNTLTVYNGSIDLINGVLIDNDNSTTYQLPATPINDLQGENSIWSNTGSIANVGYLDILNIS